MVVITRLDKYRNWFKNQKTIVQIVIGGISLLVLLGILPSLPYIIGLFIVISPLVLGLFVAFKFSRSNRFHTKPIKFSSIIVVLALSIFVQSAWGSYLLDIDTNSGKESKSETTSEDVQEQIQISSEDTVTQPVTSTEQQTQEQAVDNEPAQTNATTTPEPTKVPVKATNTPAPIQNKQPENQNTLPKETVSQKNAVQTAKSYLNYTAFSYDGLVAQLEYEQFSHADAVYGVDNSGANWNEQAAKMAKQYMDYSAFSRGSLIEQLKYEKFTQEQAEYGANAVGL